MAPGPGYPLCVYMWVGLTEAGVWEGIGTDHDGQGCLEAETETEVKFCRERQG